MKKLAFAAFIILVNPAFAGSEELKPTQVNRFTACVQQWRDLKATEGFKPEKGQYRTHMSGCLKKSSGPTTRAAKVE